MSEIQCPSDNVKCANDSILQNILRGMTMLENSLDRLMRNNFYDSAQYPIKYFDIKSLLISMRSWITDYKMFSGTENFACLLSMLLTELSEMILKLFDIISSENGKKQTSKKHKEQQKQSIRSAIDSILDNVLSAINSLEIYETDMSLQLEKYVQQAFEQHMSTTHEVKVQLCESSRGKKTIVFPFANPDEYDDMISNRTRFKKEILEKLSSEHQTGHTINCPRTNSFKLIGYRSSPRKTKMKDGKKRIFEIRMAKCKSCGEKFSFLPSFLPREKHFEIDIIGNIVKKILLFNNSIRAAFNSVNDFVKIKSKQTVFNWLKWIGTLHPAQILSRAGINGSGYLHEDEGFEKEIEMRTYSVVLVDPESMLVWHADYVDHVNEKSLSESFGIFLEHIAFKVIGVSKDKWKASTNSLKKIIKGIWIGYCHRHFKKNFWDSLKKYQEETKCSNQVIAELYKEFKNVLDQSTSSTNMIVRLQKLEKRKEYNHPILQKRLDEMKLDAPHYTMHNKRKGVTKTTFAVDNYLKIIKRKLKTVESFRDEEMTRLTFQGMANVRNFVPFMSGAKNAHKSPFELAGGETYDLSWIQTMNVHNAFLFNPTAYKKIQNL
jgi:hypothetical protein